MDIIHKISKVITNCQYDLTEFFKDTKDFWDTFDNVQEKNEFENAEQERIIQELYDELDAHIKFRSNYNWGAEAYL